MTPEDEANIAKIALISKDAEIVDRAASKASLINQEFQRLIDDGKFRGNAIIFEPLVNGVVRRVLNPDMSYFLIGGSYHGFQQSDSLRFIREASLGTPLIEPPTLTFLKWLWIHEKGNIRYLSRLSQTEIQRILGR